MQTILIKLVKLIKFLKKVRSYYLNESTIKIRKECWYCKVHKHVHVEFMQPLAEFLLFFKVSIYNFKVLTINMQKVLLYQIWCCETKCILGFCDFDKYPRQAFFAIGTFWTTVELQKEASSWVIGCHYW